MSKVFPIAPASPKVIGLLAVIIILLSIVLAALAYTGYSAYHSRVEVHHGQIHIMGDFWARSLPIQSLDLERAEILNLSRQSKYALRVRTFGTSLPGYSSGWFRLRNGEKALAYLTSQKSVVYLPTSLGYSLLLNVKQPHEFLSTLRSQSDR